MREPIHATVLSSMNTAGNDEYAAGVVAIDATPPRSYEQVYGAVTVNVAQPHGVEAKGIPWSTTSVGPE